MAIEWMLRTERVGWEDEIVDALQSGWEPFGVWEDEDGEMAIYFKKQIVVERDPKATDRAS
jgi:hypothetical protein